MTVNKKKSKPSRKCRKTIKVMGYEYICNQKMGHGGYCHGTVSADSRP